MTNLLFQDVVMVCTGMQCEREGNMSFEHLVAIGKCCAMSHCHLAGCAGLRKDLVGLVPAGDPKTSNKLSNLHMMVANGCQIQFVKAVCNSTEHSHASYGSVLCFHYLEAWIRGMLDGPFQDSGLMQLGRCDHVLEGLLTCVRMLGHGHFCKRS